MVLKKKILENENRSKKAIDYPALRETLEEAVKKAIPGTEKFGVAFSGGIDSGVIAFLAGKMSKNAILLSVGLPRKHGFRARETFSEKNENKNCHTHTDRRRNHEKLCACKENFEDKG